MPNELKAGISKTIVNGQVATETEYVNFQIIKNERGYVVVLNGVSSEYLDRLGALCRLSAYILHQAD